MISIDKVYKTVLYILNKEQTGHITPEEFNSFAEQAQRDIFNGYFNESSMYSRQPAFDKEYTDKIDMLEQRLAYFKGFVNLPEVSGSVTDGEFELPSKVFYIDTVSHEHSVNSENIISEITPINRRDYVLMNNSPLVKPSLMHAVFLREGDEIKVSPNSIKKITVDYIKEPSVPEWKYNLNSLGIAQYKAYNDTDKEDIKGSIDFELHESEQPALIFKILVYCGVVLKDPSIVQTAMAASAGEEQQKLR
jgi:hypothetical protein